MRLRLIPLVVLMLALPMVASACSAKLASPAAALMAASQKAETVDTVGYRMAMDWSGLEDLYPEDDEFFLDLSFEMEGAIDTANERMWMRATTFGTEQEYRYLDGVTYVSVNDKWVRDDESWMGDPEALLGFLSTDDPLDLVREIGGDAANVESFGAEDVDGEMWTRFSGTIDGLMGDDIFAEESATFELWIDEDDWVRKVVLTSAFDMDDLYWDEDEHPVMRTDVSVSMVLEFFDYGEPVEVEAPPEDLIVTWEEAYGDDYFGDDDWSFENPFEGADCYGELLSNCFATNPEVDAMAADPALCQGVDARVCLVPVGKVRADVVQAIIDFHRDTAGIEVLVLPGIPLTDADVLEETSQIVDSTLWALMEEHAGVTSYDTPSTHIAITEIDVADDPGGYSWMFGSRWGNGPTGHTHGVFSYFRMLYLEPYDGSPITDELIHERVAKYAARYTALLHLKAVPTDDIDYLNYYEMYGFADLDSMGTLWPDGSGPCLGEGPVICLVPDGIYEMDYGLLGEDLEIVADRLSRELGITVEVAAVAGGYYPTQPSWSEEFATDLRNTAQGLLTRPNVTVIGVTDDKLSQDPTVDVHMDAVWPGDRLAIVSAHLYGYSGQAAPQERLYRLLYRAIARAHYGLPLTSETGQLLSDDVVAPYQLDDVVLPPLP